MGPKLMNCYRPEQMDTNEFGKMVKRIQILEEGRVSAKKAKNWRFEGEKTRITRMEYQRLFNNFDMEGLMTQKKGLWNLAKEKNMKETGEEEERTARAEKKEEETGEKRKREEEKEENESGTVKRRCEGLVSVAFEIFGPGKDLESCGDLSWEDSMEDLVNWSDCEPDSCGRVRGA